MTVFYSMTDTASSLEFLPGVVSKEQREEEQLPQPKTGDSESALLLSLGCLGRGGREREGGIERGGWERDKGRGGRVGIILALHGWTEKEKKTTLQKPGPLAFYL